MSFDSTYVKIDLDIIAANFAAVKAKAGVDVMAVVKADAYGHGAIQVARQLQDDCAFFGVSSMLEAMELRQAGLQNPILILGHTPVRSFSTAIREGILYMMVADNGSGIEVTSSTAQVLLNDQVVGEGTGSSKKRAEQDAARTALEKLKK